MNNRLFLLFAAFFFTIGTSFAQRIVYVDTEYILQKLPQYQTAKEELLSISAEWNEQIKKQEDELVALKNKFDQEKLLLPDSKKIMKENEIQELTSKLSSLKRKRFGPKGDLFQKQQALIQPIQDEIFLAIKQVAERRDYDYVLDKSKGVSILYVKPKFDMSEEVLRLLTK